MRKHNKGKLNNKNGFTLIELVAVIAVAAILFAAVIPAVKNAGDNGKVTSTMDTLKSVQTAAAGYYTDNSTFTGVTAAALAASGKYLPATFTGTGANAFGGDITATVNADPTKVDVKLTKVPSAASTKLIAALNKSAEATSYDSPSQTLTITY